MAIAGPVRVVRPRRKFLAAVAIVLAIIVVATTVVYRPATPPRVTPSIDISGYVTAGDLGNVTGIVFTLVTQVNGYVGPVPFASTVTPEGQYSVTVPNNATYAVGIDFISPSGLEGTCNNTTVVVSQPTGNSSLAYNFSCSRPYMSLGQ